MRDIDKIDNENEDVLPFDDDDIDESIITLEDEDGNTGDFEILDVIEYRGSEYAVLCSVEENDDGDTVVVLRIVEGSDDDDDDSVEFLLPDSEEEADAVYEIFKEKYKDIIEFED